MKTYFPKTEEITHSWHLVDAQGKVLGRLASQVAKILIGKHKPDYTPHLDNGDGVVVINAAKIVVTGRKLAQKTYTRYSGYPGGLRTENLAKKMQKDPSWVVYHAVAGMLPKKPLGNKMLKKLRVYAGSAHRQGAQSPQPLELVK